MEINLSEKLKSLRKSKNVSQEKLAQYLNVSFQAVSKWENGGTYPDISLLPEIARYFGITVDELLQAEKLDEEKLYREYEEKTAEMYRNGHSFSDLISIWEEAYHKMPNHIHVKEMLMSAYFDTDKVKYQNEIIELGTELYNSNAPAYYKGQAIMEIARTYAENNNMEMAKRWADKSYQLMHSTEMIYMQILSDGKELLEQFSFANYWYFNNLFYMSARLCNCRNLPGDTACLQAVEKVITQLYEIVYPDDDMSFESLRLMCIQHRCIAEDETTLGRDENVIRHHLTRAFECARKSCHVTEHDLTHPLLMNWHIDAAPAENKQIVQQLQSELTWECFDSWRNKDWFAALEGELKELLL